MLKDGGYMCRWSTNGRGQAGKRPEGTNKPGVFWGLWTEHMWLHNRLCCREGAGSVIRLGRLLFVDVHLILYRALSPGQEDPLRVSKQLRSLTKWCSGKPDLVGCAWRTGRSRELARKPWLRAQLRRQASGPELYSSTISDSPSTAVTFRQTLNQYSHPDMAGSRAPSWLPALPSH